MDPREITLLLGVDRHHLAELRANWPGWRRFKPDLLEMPGVCFYDATEVAPEVIRGACDHPNLRLVPWEVPAARSQREKMLTGFIQVAAREVSTRWYLKIDTDVAATKEGEWIDERWFSVTGGSEPVYVASPWGYTKPRYALDLLDDWGDTVPDLARHPRLNVPYSSNETRVCSPRMISWLMFGRTDWTRKVAGWAAPDGRLPIPSQDTYLYYCAARLREPVSRVRMKDFGWSHGKRADEGEREVKVSQRNGARKPGGVHPLSRGIVYFNMGTGCAVRLLVSLRSLRRVYEGPVTIVSVGEDSHLLCNRIGAALGADVVRWAPPIPPGRNTAYVAKTFLATVTPYELTLVIDSDTVVLRPIDEMFSHAEEREFCVTRMAAWKTRGKRMSKRIRLWERLLPEDIEKALAFGPAINTGVFSFRKDAAILKEWQKMSLLGRENMLTDETCCQVLLHRYRHSVVDSYFNCSCAHDDPSSPQTRVIHYHGRKHCRPGLPFHGARWVKEYESAREENIADMRSWLPGSDRVLKAFVRGRLHSQNGTCLRRIASDGGKDVRLILGAGKTSQEGWLSTDKGTLDITDLKSWERILQGKLAESLMAEHVWEHLSLDDGEKAARNCHRFLQEGGRLRIAVPDALHPSPRYRERVKPGGPGRKRSNTRYFSTIAFLGVFSQTRDS
jgi:hypothetical protein